MPFVLNPDLTSSHFPGLVHPFSAFSQLNKYLLLPLALTTGTNFPYQCGLQHCTNKARNHTVKILVKIPEEMGE